MSNRNYGCRLLLFLLLALTGCQSLHLGGKTAGIGGPGKNRRCPDSRLLTDQVVAQCINVSAERLAALKTSRSLTNNDICTMPDAALQRALARLDRPKADHPGEWAEFRNLQRRDKDGKVKPDGLLKGIEHRKALLKKSAANAAPAPAGDSATIAASGNPVLPAAGISSNQWSPLGPSNIGGRIRAILIDPANTGRMWLGSVSGGIWHSADGGASWNPVNDFMGNLSVSSLVMAPNDPNVLYAGTGEGFYNGDAVRGAGVFKSTDGGVTWSQLPATNPAADSGWYYVNRIAIHPSDGNILLAATNSGTYRSSDGGNSWSMVDPDRMLDVHFDPNNPGNAIAAGSYGNIIYSYDGGITWTPVTIASLGWLGRVEIAYAKSQPDTVYASVNNSSGEIWKSIDGGATWERVSIPQHLGSQGWYDNTIWVDPTDAFHLVIGGLDLWRSTDGGLSWTRISNWVNNMYNGLPQVPHADHHVLVADPGYNGTTNKKLYNGNDGGIFRAADISAASETGGWETLDNGLAVTQFYSGAGRTAAGGRIIGGTQDNGSLRKSATGTDWQFFFGGDGGYSAVDSQNDGYLYGEYVYLRIHRSTDGGVTESSYIYSGITDAGNNANFIAPFILDPNDNNRMLAGGASLWQSLAVKDPVPAWTSIKPSVGSNISAIAVAEGNSTKAWVGHNNGRVYQTADSLAASPTWTRVGAASLPARMVNRILIDRDDHNRVYVAFGGYSADNLYRTTDNGATWSNITGNLPAVPIFTIVRHPVNADWLYAGTEVGLFTSQDGGNAWYTTNDGPANVEISELSWLDNSTLLAATHGRGMFKVTVESGPDTTPPTVTITTPANGATGVDVGNPVTARFSESMAANTINSASFTLDNGVTGAVSYNVATMTATFTPSTRLAYSTTYTATITTGVNDLAGNPLAAAKTWSFTTMAQPASEENFSAGILPAGWRVVDNAGTGKGWRFDDPGGRTNKTGGAGSLAIADSDFTQWAAMDTELRSPAFDMTAFSTVTFSFKTDFYYYAGGLNEIADVDVSVNGPAGPWTNVWKKTVDYRGPKAEQFDISALAAGKSNVMVRFHYFNANWDWYWQVDDVVVLGSAASAVQLLNPGPASYPTLQTAYGNATNSGAIQAQATTFTENLSFANDIAVVLQGGFDAGYTANSGGYSTLNGALKVRNGKVKIENFRFR